MKIPAAIFGGWSAFCVLGGAANAQVTAERLLKCVEGAAETG